MPRARNPFRPTFGATPPLLVGRGDLIDLFGDALDEGAGSPARATLYTGARGVGKTVMLNAVEEEARRRGWLVISETALPGLLERMVGEHLPALLRTHDTKRRRRQLSGVNAAVVGTGGGVTWDISDPHQVAMGLRTQITRLAELLAGHETGLLVTIDELHRDELPDLRQIFAVVQHAFRENRPVAFAGAGLPSVISTLLGDKTVTFLRRADRHALGAVELDDVAAAIRTPIERGGRTINARALDTATAATGGYPFLIQLVGYQIWRQQPNRKVISPADVAAGVAAARRRMGALVHEPSLADTSHIDRTFLVAMAHDDGPSRVGDIARRLGVGSNYAGQYRLRLIQAELIHPAGFGRVDFSLPYLREYLRDHATALVADR